MRLLIQPEDGVAPLIKAINRARHILEIAIFRFDQKEIENALAHAVSRGVSVRALIAHTNRDGEQNLRRLEMRLLAAGVTVARTADDLPRYHGKLMIVDRAELYLLSFNLTYQDIERSRSFGIVTRHRSLVREAVKLFEADSKRNPYEPGLDSLVVSPANARRQLAAFIQGARTQLLIYDPKIADSAMIKLLEERAKAGVDVRIIGKLTREGTGLAARKLTPRRLHMRAIVRDGRWGFVGSQSLRGIELDMRREVGAIFRDSNVASRMAKTFEDDWCTIEEDRERMRAAEPAEKLAKRVAKLVAQELPAVASVVDGVVADGPIENGNLDLKADVQERVKVAVKEAVREAVKDAMAEAAGQGGGAAR
jgi:cardiolipin synthase